MIAAALLRLALIVAVFAVSLGAVAAALSDIPWLQTVGMVVMVVELLLVLFLLLLANESRQR